MGLSAIAEYVAAGNRSPRVRPSPLLGPSVVFRIAGQFLPPAPVILKLQPSSTRRAKQPQLPLGPFSTRFCLSESFLVAELGKRISTFSQQSSGSRFPAPLKFPKTSWKL